MDQNNSNVFNGPNTKVACLNCREKKLKCDKILPACLRCSNKGVRCVYVSHKKTGPKPTQKKDSEKLERPLKKKKILQSNSINNGGLEEFGINPSKVMSEEHNINNGIVNTNNNATVNSSEIIHSNAKDLSNALSSNNNGGGNVDNSNNNSTNIKEKNENDQGVLNLPGPVNEPTDISAFILTEEQRIKLESIPSGYQLGPYQSLSSQNIGGYKEDMQYPITAVATSADTINSEAATATVTSTAMSIKTITGSTETNPTVSKPNGSPTSVFTPQQEPSPNKPPYKQIPSVKHIATPQFKEALGLYRLGLTIDDIDKFHAFYFNSNTRPFKYSTARYFHWFIEDPKSILHYSYIIWTLACFYLDDYTTKVDLMYEKALEQMNSYWESNRDSFHAEILPYLHSLCLKAQFEFMSGREMRAALTVASSIRLTQMFGYDQIDLSPNMLGSPAIFFKSFNLDDSTNHFLKDDKYDSELPLVEERRRVLWEIYTIDKWSSLVTGLPCAFSVDNHSVIFTKLPSPTTFLPLNNEQQNDIESSINEGENSYYLHEAMEKLDKNQVLIDINSSSSKVLLLTISENIIKWCKMFLNMVELDSLKSDGSIDSIRNKVDELVKNFESMHSNLLFFDLTTEPLMNIVITNTTTLLYQSVLIKFSSLFDIQLKENSVITDKERALFTDLLTHVSVMSATIVLRFINKTKLEHHLKKVPIFVIFLNSIKSLFQCAAFFKRFKIILPKHEGAVPNDSNLLLKYIRDGNNNMNVEKIVSISLELTNNRIDKLYGSVSGKAKRVLRMGMLRLARNPELISFFDSFIESYGDH